MNKNKFDILTLLIMVFSSGFLGGLVPIFLSNPIDYIPVCVMIGFVNGLTQMYFWNYIWYKYFDRP